MTANGRKLFGFTIILLGSAASFGNFLWLIGILPKPDNDLMTARWIYTSVSYMFSFFILEMP